MNASDECARLDVAVRNARAYADPYDGRHAWGRYLTALDLALDAVGIA